MRSENHSSFAIDCIEVLRFYVPQNNIRKRFIGLRVIRSIVLFLSGIHPSELNVGNGRTFRIVVHNNSDQNIYIQSAKLNGKRYSKSYLSFEDITKGGTLGLQMGSTPSKKWGVKKKYRP